MGEGERGWERRRGWQVASTVTFLFARMCDAATAGECVSLPGGAAVVSQLLVVPQNVVVSNVDVSKVVVSNVVVLNVVVSEAVVSKVVVSKAVVSKAVVVSFGVVSRVVTVKGVVVSVSVPVVVSLPVSSVNDGVEVLSSVVMGSVKSVVVMVLLKVSLSHHSGMCHI
jgi:hypothetical protein